MGIFDYFRLLKRINTLESGVAEELEGYLEGLDDLENRIVSLERSLQGHMAVSKRWDAVRGEPKDIITLGNNEDIKDESVKEYIRQVGESPRDSLMRLIKEGKWQ